MQIRALREYDAHQLLPNHDSTVRFLPLMNMDEIRCRTPLELWPGMEEKHAYHLYVMGWSPSPNTGHIELDTVDHMILDEPLWSSVHINAKMARECAEAMLAAADYIEQKYAEHLRQKNHGQRKEDLHAEPPDGTGGSC
jgi:hypothetical protein